MERLYSWTNSYSQEESIKRTRSGGQIKGQGYDYYKIERVKKSPLRDIRNRISTAYIINRKQK